MDELSTAILIAREAGARLLTEFHRSGGPRGHGGHAEIDAEVERQIREHLHREYPRDGFLGEETGTVAPRPEVTMSRVWVVDPNDGTREFLRGHRGPSVSIALVQGGLPLLGVVFAYAAPDDRGDLVAGGPGIGLHRERSGTVQRIAVVSEPDPRAMVSFGASRSATILEANAELCDPWEPVPVPGIAYRLARTACGEARVATTLTGPYAWDMAGGHALLLAAGLELYTAEGTAVRYDDLGGCTRSVAYFGGRREDVDVLRGRDWHALIRKTDV